MTGSARAWVFLAPRRANRAIGRRTRRRQTAAFALALTGHVLLLARLGLTAPVSAPAPPSPDDRVVMVSFIRDIDLSTLSSASKAPTPAAMKREATAQPVTGDTAEVTAQPLTLSQLTPVSLTTQPAPLDAGGAPSAPPASDPAPAVAGPPCDLTALLQARLQADDRVRDALSRVPRQARSVANAIMLWDGRWTRIAEPGAGDDPVQQAIVEGVRAAPSDCQAQPVIGPRLLSVNDDKGATILALGSGAWRWSDLLPTAANLQ